MLTKARLSYIVPIVFALVIMVVLENRYNGNGDSLVTARIVDTFSDIDNDGDDDYIITADVVLNGSTNFLLIEPEIDDIIEEDKDAVAVFTLFSKVDEPLMSSGESYDEWSNKAAGCPNDYPYWTTITLPGGESFTCLHRMNIPYYKALNDGEIYIQLLIDSLPVPAETRVKVRVEFP